MIKELGEFVVISINLENPPSDCLNFRFWKTKYMSMVHKKIKNIFSVSYRIKIMYNQDYQKINFMIPYEEKDEIETLKNLIALEKIMEQCND